MRMTCLPIVALIFATATIIDVGCGGNSAIPFSTPAPTHAPSPMPTSTHTPSSTATQLYVSTGQFTNGPVEGFALPLTTTSATTATIWGENTPTNMAFDATHRLFVANSDNAVQVFTQPITNGAAASFHLRLGPGPAIDVKFDSAGDAFVVEQDGSVANDGIVSVFLAPITSSSSDKLSLITVHHHLASIAFDASNNFWAADVYTFSIPWTTSIDRFAPPDSAGLIGAMNLQFSTGSDPMGGLAFAPPGTFTGLARAASTSSNLRSLPRRKRRSRSAPEELQQTTLPLMRRAIFMSL